MELNFKQYIEGIYGLNAAGRAGQHVWKPEKLVINPSPKIEKPKKIKGANIDNGFRPGLLSYFKGLSGKDFGIKVKQIKKPSEN